MDRFARAPVPKQRRLALVGQADGDDSPPASLRRRQGAARDLQRRAPNILGSVLDPAGMRKFLRELFLRQGHHFARGVEDDGAAAGGALVDGKNERVVGHVVVYIRASWRSGAKR